MKDWKETDQNVAYYFSVDNGLIVGQVHLIAHTNIWLAKIMLSYNEEKYLGNFISYEYSKRAVEKFWNTQERTLEHSA